MGRRVERFEDLIAWQKARELSRRIRELTRRSPLSQDRSLCDQMRRSSQSVMADIAEGFDRASRREFHRFLVIAKGSCAELRSDLYALLDDGLISQAEFDQLYEMCLEVGRIVGGLRLSVASKRDE